jgi:hypothetical protein
MSRPFGRSTGGNPFTLACPTGQVLRGLEIVCQSGYGVNAVTPHCGSLRAETADGGSAVAVVPGATLGTAGWTMPPMAVTFSFDCPEGVITSILGQEGQNGGSLQLGGFSVGCGRLSISGVPGALTLTTVDTGSSTPQGSVVMSAPFSFACPAPQVAATFSGHAGAWIDQLAVQCTSLSLVLKP